MSHTAHHDGAVQGAALSSLKLLERLMACERAAPADTPAAIGHPPGAACHLDLGQLRQDYCGMTAARPKPFTQGASSERLAQYILGNLSFVTPVPYPEDVGHDFHCVTNVALEGDNKLVHSGPAFSVQVKSRTAPLVYTKDYERKWIGEQANPFFLCVANRSSLTCDIYSTWNVLNGVLLHGTGIHPGQTHSASRTTKVVLKPGVANRANVEPDPRHPYGSVALSDDGVLTIPLGPPILSLKPEMVNSPNEAAKWAVILREWVDLDRANIVRVTSGMYWVYGPRQWRSNERAWASGVISEATYANVANFGYDDANPYRSSAVENFVRAADALRRVVAEFDRHGIPRLLLPDQVAVLDQALKLFEPYKNTISANLLWRVRGTTN